MLIWMACHSGGHCVVDKHYLTSPSHRPHSNVLSFSDGALGNSTGRILLLMADMDSTVVDLKANAHASFTVTEAQLLPGACAGRDVEDPTCAKVVLVGTLRQLSDDDVTAREMVFARHPLMRAWHAHMYHVYELDIQAIRVLDYYGGFGWPSVQHYFAWHESVTLQ